MFVGKPEFPLANLGPYSQRFIFFVTYKWAYLARVFVFDRFIQPSLMFVGKSELPLAKFGAVFTTFHFLCNLQMGLIS
jgi:hypothetical protein